MCYCDVHILFLVLRESYLQKELAFTSSHNDKLFFVGISPIEYLYIQKKNYNKFHVFWAAL